MRAFVVTASFALLALQSVSLAAAGTAADAIAEKFARASETSRSQTEPAPLDATAASRSDTAERARLQAEREAETLHLAERLRAARRAKAEALDREERERQSAEAAKEAAVPLPASKPADAASCPSSDRAGAAAPPAISAVAMASPAPTDAAAATILLSLDPGTYGLRRFNPTSADPVLCIGETCYISQGAATPARALTRSAALGAGNTLGGRAGACRTKLVCVFRDVPLPAPRAELQPVDLHILRHDRREIASAVPDASCRINAGRLTCGNVIRSATYRALVVPEQVARSAGSTALEATLPALSTTKTAAIAAR